MGVIDFELSRIHKTVSRYDNRLYAMRDGLGIIQVYRMAKRLDASMVPDDHRISELRLANNPQFIFALTDNWQLTGSPVPWGVEPVLARLREMDSWNSSDDGYQEMLKNRDKAQAEQVRQRGNEFRAIAADARREFAKAVGDINTSTIRSK